MAQRPTRKAGLLKPRVDDPKIQKSFDAIIERLEVLDGLRGDILDKAVTYRELGDSGFVFGRGTGVPPIINTPGPGDGGTGGTPVPGTGPPSKAPDTLSATETFLAILLSWVSYQNVAYTEVWRSIPNPDPDNPDLSTAVRIATSRLGKWVDYVGASVCYWYWVRDVGTDGSFSAYSEPAYACTGIDPRDFEFELNISAQQLDDALNARIDLIDVPGVIDSLMNRVGVLQGESLDYEERITELRVDTDTITNITIPGLDQKIDGNAQIVEQQYAKITYVDDQDGLLDDRLGDAESTLVIQSGKILALEANIGVLDTDSGKAWDFTGTNEGFTASGGTITVGGDSIVYALTASDSRIISPNISAENLSGSINTQVVMKMRLNSGSGTWEGRLYYSTNGHTIGSYYKDIPDPQLSLSEWKILTWDMTEVSGAAPTTDWTDSRINQLRFDLFSSGTASIEIDYIYVGKFSSAAFSQAIDALDARVLENEQAIGAQATSITNLTSALQGGGPLAGDLSDTIASSQAVSGLTTDVYGDISEGLGINSRISTNASDISGLTSQISGKADATALNQLTSYVEQTVEGNITANAQNITQLSAGVIGATVPGYVSFVNPLNQPNEIYGTTYTTDEIGTFANIGGRSGAAAIVSTTSNLTDVVRGADNTRIKLHPRGVYEVKFSAYHAKTGGATGSFYFGLWAKNSSGNNINVTPIKNGATLAGTTNAYWGAATEDLAGNTWLDVTCYLLGPEAAVANCPPLSINGTTNDEAQKTLVNGFRRQGYIIPAEGEVELRFLNWNTSPNYGNNQGTTLYVTDLVMRRIDGTASADQYAALQVEASVTASALGDLNALYAITVDLNGAVSGYGLAANITETGTYDSAFVINADQFVVTGRGENEGSKPFSVDAITNQVGIEGDLIVKNSIRASSIVAGQLQARHIFGEAADSLVSSTGILSVGRLTTSAEGKPAFVNFEPTTPPDQWYQNQSNFRVEIEGLGATYPIWYGSGLGKTSQKGLFYVDLNGDVVVKGKLKAGIIEQSLFAPAGNENSWRIATQYNPNTVWAAANYLSGGGKTAHILPMKSVSFVDNTNHTSGQHQGTFGSGFSQSGNVYSPKYSSQITFYGPNYTGATVYGRLGSYSENMMVYMSACTSKRDNSDSLNKFTATLQYQYNSEGWKNAWYVDWEKDRSSAMSNMQVFNSRSTAWNTLQFRVKVQPSSGPTSQKCALSMLNLCVWLPNFGYADVVPQQQAANVTTQSLNNKLAPRWI